jgi:CPA1 family monovalent cation:H+ antiporter
MTTALIGPFEAAAILIVLAAGLGYINHRFLRLPASVGLTFMGALASLAVIGIDYLLPGVRLSDMLAEFLKGVDFQATLMNGMLSFLLFAGALHVDWSDMRNGRWPILALSTLGVLMSTALVGFGFYYLAPLFGLHAPLTWCIVFGALISPTDPVAVMAVLKAAHVPRTLSATVAGESLFNDGVGVVVFGIALSIAMGGEKFTLAHAAWDFVREAGGGVLLGLAAGWIAYALMRSIDDYNVEAMITLAVVMGGYSLAQHVGVSGPVAMAVAGLIIGNAAVSDAMSDATRDHVMKFWSLIDEILNAVLFLLIGLEFVAVAQGGKLILLGAAAIPLVLLARFISVGAPMLTLRPIVKLGPLAMPTLVWGGLRGGISVALALSISQNEARSVLLAATYVVVLFAVLIQGGTISRVIIRVKARHPELT